MYVTSVMSGRAKRLPVAAGGHTFFTLVSNGTTDNCTLGCWRNWVTSRRSARTRAGSVTPGGTTTATCSQKPLPSCEPGGSDTHTLPDSSMTSTTFTGNPAGLAGAVQTRPVSVSRSSRSVGSWETGSTNVS